MTRRIIAWGGAIAALAYVLFSWWTQSGLYAWIIAWENAQFGHYYPQWTVMILCTLALIPLVLLANAPRTGAQRTEEEKQRLTGRVMLGIGLACFAVAGAAYAYSQQIPDGNAPPTAIDLAALGETEPTSGNVILEGDVLTDLVFSIDEEGEYQTTTRHVAPIVPRGGGTDTPLRFFQEVKTMGGMQIAPSIFRRQGYMMPEALPAVASDAYVEAGIAVAKRTWMIKSAGWDGRAYPYIIASLAGVTGFFTLFTALLLAMRNRKQARQSRKF